MGGFVYLVCDPAKDFYKIGVTKGKIEKRLKKLQTGNGTELFVVTWHQTDYPFRMEKLLHTRFKPKRENGEWFSLDASEVANFGNICDKMEETLSVLMQNPFFNKSLPR